MHSDLAYLTVLLKKMMKKGTIIQMLMKIVIFKTQLQITTKILIIIHMKDQKSPTTADFHVNKYTLLFLTEGNVISKGAAIESILYVSISVPNPFLPQSMFDFMSLG